MLELFNNIVDKTQIPKEREAGILININKHAKITGELLYCVRPANCVQT
jgi:hypothetical protein